MEKLKQIMTSRWLRWSITLGLVYLVFRRVNFANLVADLSRVPWWFVVGMVIWSLVLTAIGAYRWSLLLFLKPDLKAVYHFSRSSLLGGFYGLILPTSMAADLLKWMPLQQQYPQLTKSKLLASAVLDRVVGFTGFIISAFVAMVVGKVIYNIGLPFYLIWLIVIMVFGVVVFYGLVMGINIDGLKRKIKFLAKFDEVWDLIKKENKAQLVKAIGVSLITEMMWMLSIWFISNIFGAGFSLVAIYVFMPIIAMIMVLPISIGGFGAREGLFLFFFSQMGYESHKILLVSAMLGVMGIINGLVGGLALVLK
jgi:uncharacterized membrane protein YbhN (UPF0104 family)